MSRNDKKNKKTSAIHKWERGTVVKELELTTILKVELLTTE